MSVYAPDRSREHRRAPELGRILDILRQTPDIPFSIDRLAEMLGSSPALVQDAVEDLEGPVASGVPGAFVYYWRFTDEVVYLP